MTPADTMTSEQLRASVTATTTWHEASTGGEAIAAGLRAARSARADDVDRLAFATRIIVSGAGSSLYTAQMGATTMRSYCRLPAEAVPLSEVMLRPRSVFARDDLTNQPVIVVSRSGATTEAIEVIRAARARDQYTLAVTCRPDSPVAGVADAVLSIPDADEEAIVMTRSVAAQTALLMRLGTRLGDPTFAADLDRMPSLWHETTLHVERAFELAATDPKRVVVLGGGVAFGLANEAVLKLTETSQVPASAFHPLEFRHGPISVCEPSVLVVGILGDESTAAERRVLEESAAYGAMTWELGTVGPGAALAPIARLPLILHALQAFALALAVRRGFDPDRPRHLGPVVVLGDR